MSRGPIRICRRCLRDLTPRRKRPAVARDAHRGENSHGTKLSPEAEKLRARKERKRQRREGTYMTHAVVKLVLSGASGLSPLPPVMESEECERCLELNRSAA